jgi:hypothetical protein
MGRSYKHSAKDNKVFQIIKILGIKQIINSFHLTINLDRAK